MLIFRKKYFLLTVILLVIEILIALVVHDHFIRPYLGDFFVVMLMYCFVQAFFSVHVRYAAIAVLLFAYIVEISQYFHFITYLGWQHSPIARAILGTSFAWSDIIAYTLGIIAVVIVEPKPRYSLHLFL